MKPYFDRYPGNEKKAVQHYEQNIRLAESLEPSLSIFEVTLRNAVIRESVPGVTSVMSVILWLPS